MGKALGGGSGWVLLVFQPREGTLVNQWAADHTHALAGGVPILALDMYEHAYHMDFGAAAGAYVDAFMANIDWAAVYARYQAAVHAASEPLRRHAGRRAAARCCSTCGAPASSNRRGTMIPGARWCDPAGVSAWAGELPADRDVVVYCVYGHEVGRATAHAPARRRPECALPARRHRRLAEGRSAGAAEDRCVVRNGSEG